MEEEDAGVREGGAMEGLAVTTVDQLTPSQSTQKSEASVSTPDAAKEGMGVESMWEEIASLKEVLAGDEPRLEAIEQPADTNTSTNRRKLVARLAEGKSNTLESLTRAIACQLFGGEEGENRPIVRNLILDVASRKYYGTKQEMREDIDTFEDETLAPFWFWESRVMSDLPEELRGFANLARKKRKSVQERLNALMDAIKMMEDINGPKRPSEAKLNRCRQKLARTQDLQSILETCRSKEASQAQKVKHAQESISERAAKSAQKTVEKERKAVEALGFGSKKSLSKAQNLLKSFAVPKASKEKSQREVQNGSQPQEVNSFYQRFTPCPPNKRLCFTPGDPAAMNGLDVTLTQSVREEEVVSTFTNTSERWRKTSRVRIKGMPPTWARKSDCPKTFHDLALREYGESYYPDDIIVRRYKYLWFPCDSDCPPYYGSWTANFQISRVDPFVKHPKLDYEEDFDEGWEEEPEGESLSEDEEGEEEVEDKESQDGFVVDDGYLSEDEGIQEFDLGGLIDVNDQDEASMVLSISDQSEKQKKMLQSIVDHARKTGKPVVLSRLRAQETPENTPVLFTSGSMELLQSMKVRRTSLDVINVPSATETSMPALDTEKKLYPRGRSKQILSPELTSDLIELLRSSPNSKEKIVEAFLMSHPQSKIPKVCVRDKIAELCEYDVLHRVWVLKSEAPGSNVQLQKDCEVAHPNNNTPECALGCSVPPKGSFVTSADQPHPIPRGEDAAAVASFQQAGPAGIQLPIPLSRHHPLSDCFAVSHNEVTSMAVDNNIAPSRVSEDLMDEDDRSRRG